MVTSAIKYPMALTLCLVILGCPPVISTTVTVHPNPTTIEVGQTVQLTAASTSAADTGFDWESSDPAVAVVSASGLVTGLADGAAWITATGQGSGAQATAVVTVLPPITVTVTPDPASIEVGQVVQLTATSTDASDYGFGWSSSNPAIAAVNATGLVTGVAEGSVEITATGQGSGVSGTATVNVSGIPPVQEHAYGPAQSVTRTADGGYVATGSTLENDLFIVKVDGSGDEVWATRRGSLWHDGGLSVVRTADGGYAAAGYSEYFDHSQMYLVKVDRDGNFQWDRTYGSGYCGAFSLEASGNRYTLAGGIIQNGRTNAYVVQANADGNQRWERTYGSEATTDVAYALAWMPYGVLMAGSTTLGGGHDPNMYLVSIGANGGPEQWSGIFGGTGDDVAYAVTPTADGAILLVGSTSSEGIATALDMCIMKVGADGTRYWTKTFGGGSNEEAFAVATGRHDGYVIVGYTESFGPGTSDAYIVKVDNDGNEEWSQVLGGPRDDAAYGVDQALGGGYIVCGYSRNFSSTAEFMTLTKLAEDGTVEWSRVYDGLPDE